MLGRSFLRSRFSCVTASPQLPLASPHARLAVRAPALSPHFFATRSFSVIHPYSSKKMAGANSTVELAPLLSACHDLAMQAGAIVRDVFLSGNLQVLFVSSFFTSQLLYENIIFTKRSAIAISVEHAKILL